MTRIFIGLGAIVVLIIVITLLAMRYLRGDALEAEDDADELAGLPERAGRTVRGGRDDAGWADWSPQAGRPAAVSADPAAARLGCEPGAARPVSSAGPERIRPVTAPAGAAGAASRARTDHLAAQPVDPGREGWDSLSDLDYWARLSAERQGAARNRSPLATSGPDRPQPDRARSDRAQADRAQQYLPGQYLPGPAGSSLAGARDGASTGRADLTDRTELLPVITTSAPAHHGSWPAPASQPAPAPAGPRGYLPAPADASWHPAPARGDALPASPGGRHGRPDGGSAANRPASRTVSGNWGSPGSAGGARPAASDPRDGYLPASPRSHSGQPSRQVSPRDPYPATSQPSGYTGRRRSSAPGFSDWDGQVPTGRPGEPAVPDAQRPGPGGRAAGGYDSPQPGPAVAADPLRPRLADPYSGSSQAAGPASAATGHYPGSRSGYSAQGRSGAGYPASGYPRYGSLDGRQAPARPAAPRERGYPHGEGYWPQEQGPVG